MVEESNIGSVVNVHKWLEKNEESFKPPVCNSVMAGGYLKIMFVGGPNSRKDYHLDQGEEFFYMLKGDMCLKIMERGEPKDIYIKEGEVFVLPSRIPHSPQRFENTLGLVIERDRSELWDGLRYYCEDGKTILFQKFFHLRSLVDDLLPVIKEYFASEQCKTGRPIPGTMDTDEKIFKVNEETIVNPPFSLDKWISENEKKIQNGGKTLFGVGEFKINVYGKGTHEILNYYETWLWMKNGIGSVQIEDKISELSNDDSLIIPQGKRFSLKIEEGKQYCLVFMMDPTATPQK